MTPQEIARIKEALSSETAYSFIEFVTSAEDIRAAREGIAASIGYVYNPMLAQLRGGEYATLVKEYFESFILKKLEVLRSIIADHVCPQFCAWKASGKLDSEALKIAISVADALVSAKVAFPAPVVRVAAYVVRNQVLDSWCACTLQKS